RNIYGYYLKDIFDTAIRKKPEYTSISFVHDEAIDIEEEDGKAHIYFSVSPGVIADKVILAIGNQSPDNPVLNDKSFYSSRKYYGNPWLHEAVNHLDPQKEVFILGNGLTMVDIVLGLKEKKHKGKIYSLSPNGFQILPHRVFEPYRGLIEELSPPYDLPKVVSLFRSHVKKLRDEGLAGEAAVDSLRPLTQKVWQSWSKQEKERFMYHIRHMWGVARHRLPMDIHKMIQQLILDDKLEIIAGRTQGMEETQDGVKVIFKRRRDQKMYEVNVGRVINCTGPLSDINKLERPLIKNLISRKLIHPDEMKLGIDTTADGNILNIDGTSSKYLFTIGSTMRGLLWESTAVPELRDQAKKLAAKLLSELGE
ncbi:MAG: FAD/NAD(P)-binding protein, partial [Bacteroidota bacterium]